MEDSHIIIQSVRTGVGRTEGVTDGFAFSGRLCYTVSMHFKIGGKHPSESTETGTGTGAAAFFGEKQVSAQQNHPEKVNRIIKCHENDIVFEF